MKKVSAKIRAAAIFHLDLVASNFDRWAYSSRRDEFYVDKPVSDLAYRAWTQIPGMSAVTAAEAAGILRDGWSPGDRVYVIGTGRSPWEYAYGVDGITDHEG